MWVYDNLPMLLLMVIYLISSVFPVTNNKQNLTEQPLLM